MDQKKDPDEPKKIVEVVRAPDGGWGWVVVLGSFLCNVIVDGIIFSYGLLLPELAKDLGEPKGRVAWVGSLLAGFYLIAGPLVSGLANAYGCRPVTIVGTIISAASFAIASQSPNIEILCITFGVMGGIGFGFIYLPAVVTVGFYFERRRAFATGLAVCGSGVGTFLMAPFVQYLLTQFDWRGTLLVLSGVVLNCAIFGALFRPLEPPQSVDMEAIETKRQPLLKRIMSYRDTRTLGSVEVLSSVPQISVSMPEINVAANISDSPMSSNKNSPPPSYSDVVGADEDEMYSFLRPPPVIVPTSFDNLTSKKPRYSSRPDLSRPFYRQDILYSASLLHLPEFKKSNGDLRQYATSITKIPEVEEEVTGGCMSPAMKETFHQMLDLSLLKSPTFLLLGVGGFLTLAGFFVPFMFVVDRAVQQGVSVEQATYIVPVIGIANTIGRIFCGYISDKPYLSALAINNVALIIGGFITSLSTCFCTIELLLLYGAVFGFAIGCFATLRSIIIVDLLGLNKLTNAFGLLLLFQGIASIIGSPIAGMFYDATGSYNAPFHIAGALILISGFLSIPLPYLSRWEAKWKSRKHARAIHVLASVDIPKNGKEPVSV